MQIPIIHFSVLWWRSVHQPATILSQETASTGTAPMSTDILVTLLISVVLTTLYYFIDLRRVLIDEQKYWEDDMNKVDREKVSEPVLAEDD